MKVIDFIIRSNEELNYQNNLLKLTPADDSKLCEMKPGQFVQVLVDNSPEVFLRRPISVNFVDIERNELWLLIQRVGKGTEKICEKEVGEKLNIVYPLGKSFTIPQQNGNFLLVGGGVGTAPMLYLGQQLKERGYSPHFLLGGRSERDLLQLDEFEKYGTVHCTTEDGSYGEKGFVTNHSVLKEVDFDFIYSCGPKPMMVAVAKYAHAEEVECEVSLENLMACGIGACFCCTEKTVHGNVNSCTDGPVFNTKELLWIE